VAWEVPGRHLVQRYQVEAREDSSYGVYPLAFNVVIVAVPVRPQYGRILTTVAVDCSPACDSEADDVSAQQPESRFESHPVVYEVVVGSRVVKRENVYTRDVEGLHDVAGGLGRCFDNQILAVQWADLSSNGVVNEFFVVRILGDVKVAPVVFS
jgi:hypothetical protein